MTVTILPGALADDDGSGGVRYPMPPLGRPLAALPVPMVAVFPPLPDGRRYDPTRLHETFITLIDTHYPVFLGQLRFDDCAGGGPPTADGTNHTPIYVWQSPEVLAGGAREFVPFVVDSTTTLTTPKAIEETPFSLMPQRDYSRTLLGAKVTLLADGGLVLALDACHGLMDAQSAFRFLKLWGLLYRRDDDDNKNEDIGSQVLHDYHLLAPPTPDENVGFVHPGLQPRPPAISRVNMMEDVITSAMMAAAATGAMPMPPTRRVFHLSPTQLEHLKKLATPPSGEYVSSLDATTALFTLLLTRVRQSSPEAPAEHRRLRLTTAVNGRSRFTPPLPPHLCGSVIFFAATTLDKDDDELVADPIRAEQLQRIAQCLRRAIARHDDAFQRATLAALATADLIWQENGPDAQLLDGDDIFAVSWVRMGMFDADFGTRPAFVGPPVFPIGGGNSMFLLEDARGASEGLEVLLQIDPMTATRLDAAWATARTSLGLGSTELMKDETTDGVVP